MITPIEVFAVATVASLLVVATWAAANYFARKEIAHRAVKKLPSCLELARADAEFRAWYAEDKARWNTALAEVNTLYAATRR